MPTEAIQQHRWNLVILAYERYLGRKPTDVEVLEAANMVDRWEGEGEQEET